MKDDNWVGGYSSNDYQEMTADDAKNFAEALEKALEYLLGNKSFTEELDNGNCDEDYLVSRKDLINAWSGLEAQEMIKGFIKLFKSGACNIV